MPTKCITLVRGRRLRLTRLDDCARPIYAGDSSVTNMGWISVTATANTSETDEILVRGADGSILLREPSVASLVGYTLEMVFQNVDPELFSLATGQDVVFDAFGNAVGFDVDTSVELNSPFALEVWAGAKSTGDACELEGSQGTFGYFLMPFVSGAILGDFSITNGEINFTLTNATTREGNRWGVGPYNDIQLTALGEPGPLLAPIGRTKALRLMITEVAPPAEACGTRPLLNPAIAAITAINGVEGDDEMTADFTTTAPAVGPVWYDFGDGEWDYVTAPGAASHTYEDAGTYTVRASTNGIDWVTDTVTVPFP